MSNLKRFIAVASATVLLTGGAYSATSGQQKSQKQLKWEAEQAEKRKAKEQQKGADRQTALAQAVVVFKDDTFIT